MHADIKNILKAGYSVYLGNRFASQKKAQKPKTKNKGKNRRKGEKKEQGNEKKREGEDVRKKRPKE